MDTGIAKSMNPNSISSQVWSPQNTSALGSGLYGLLAELSNQPTTFSTVPLGRSTGLTGL